MVIWEVNQGIEVSLFLSLLPVPSLPGSWGWKYSREVGPLIQGVGVPATWSWPAVCPPVRNVEQEGDRKCHRELGREGDCSGTHCCDFGGSGAPAGGRGNPCHSGPFSPAQGSSLGQLSRPGTRPGTSLAQHRGNEPRLGHAHTPSLPSACVSIRDQPPSHPKHEWAWALDLANPMPTLIHRDWLTPGVPSVGVTGKRCLPVRVLVEMGKHKLSLTPSEGNHREPRWSMGVGSGSEGPAEGPACCPLQPQGPHLCQTPGHGSLQVPNSGPLKADLTAG